MMRVRGRSSLLIMLAWPSVAVAQAAGFAFVSNEISHSISVIDLAKNAVVATIPLPGRARGIQTSPDQKHVYVAMSDDRPNIEGPADAIADIEVATRKLVATHHAGSDPEQFAVTPDGKRLYASNEDGGTATAIDLKTGKQSRRSSSGSSRRVSPSAPTAAGCT